MRKRIACILFQMVLLTFPTVGMAQTEEEIEHVTKLMGRPQTKTSTLSFYAGYYRGNGQFQKASETYGKMADLYAADPALGKFSAKYGWALTNKALCESELGNVSQAKDLCKKALEATSGQTPENNPYDDQYLKEIKQNCIKVLGAAETKALLNSTGTTAVEAFPPKPSAATDFLCSLVPVDTSKWSQLERAGLDALKRGDLNQADNLLSQAAREAEGQGRYIDITCKSLLHLARAYYEKSDYAKASATYVRLVAAMEPYVGPNSQKLVPILAEATETAKRAGDTDGAVKIRQRMDKLISEGKSSAQNKGSWQALLQRAMEAFQVKELDKAEMFAKRACEESAGASVDDQGLCLNTFAGVLIVEGKLDQAEMVYKSLFLLFKSSPTHSVWDECNAYLGLTDIHMDRNKIKEAEGTLSQAEKILATDKPATPLQEANRQQLVARVFLIKSRIAKAQGRIEQAQEFDRLGREALKKSL